MSPRVERALQAWVDSWLNCGALNGPDPDDLPEEAELFAAYQEQREAEPAGSDKP